MANKPKFKDKQKVKGKVLKRAQKRAVKLSAAGKVPSGVSAKDGITGKEARALREAIQSLKGGGGGGSTISERANARAESSTTIPGLNYDGRYNRREARKIKQHWISEGRPAPYDPLKQVSGRNFADELKATLGYEFGDQERELRREGSRLEQNSANVGSYYDDYKNALTQSVGRIRADADSTAAATQQQVDRAQEQDKARLEAADAEAAATAAKFGRPATPSQEGQRALEARGFMAQSEQARMRERANAQVQQADLRIPNAVLAKAERLREEERRIAANRGDQQRLKQKEGEFATKYRADSREAERLWAATQKEFKLKAGESKADRKLKAQELRIENIKSYRQLKQAMLYAGAKSKMADALVKQAKKMADAKVISAKQYKEIARIQSHKTVDVNNSYSGNGGGGSGDGGRKLQPYEKTRVDRATAALAKFDRQGSLTDRDRNGKGYTAFVRRMRRYGIDAQYARIAWKRYWDKRGQTSPGGTGGGHPSTAAR